MNTKHLTFIIILIIFMPLFIFSTDWFPFSLMLLLILTFSSIRSMHLYLFRKEHQSNKELKKIEEKLFQASPVDLSQLMLGFRVTRAILFLLYITLFLGIFDYPNYLIIPIVLLAILPILEISVVKKSTLLSFIFNLYYIILLTLLLVI